MNSFLYLLLKSIFQSEPTKNVIDLTNLKFLTQQSLKDFFVIRQQYVPHINLGGAAESLKWQKNREIKFI